MKKDMQRKLWFCVGVDIAILVVLIIFLAVGKLDADQFLKGLELLPWCLLIYAGGNVGDKFAPQKTGLQGPSNKEGDIHGQ